MADYDYSNIEKNLSEGNYPAVYSELENAPSFLYGENDEVLKLLDLGIISHYMKDCDISNENLFQAENLIQKYQAKSITQSISSMMINDTVIDYSGDPYEDIYSNIFMALNYLRLQKFDDAFVEIRRFDTKQKEIAFKYQVELEQQKQQLQENASYIPDTEIEFHNSAFARYLSLLLYRTEGNISSAEVDYKKIIQAFQLQPNIYNFAMPKMLQDELCVPDTKARLNVISFAGLSPVKEEVMTSLYVAGSYCRVAVPVMLKRKSSINSVLVKATNLETNKVYSQEIEKIESIENIAVDTYSQKYSVVLAKTIGRLVGRIVANSTFEVLSHSRNQDVSTLFSLMNIASRITSVVSERADVRTSRYFPGSVYVGGINVEPGLYNVKVYYKSKNGKVLLASESTETVEKSKLNLVETFCHK